jgi:N-acetylneuraminate synthase
MRLVSNTRDVERSLGDGKKRVYASELGQLEKLRRVKTRLAETA